MEKGTLMEWGAALLAFAVGLWVGWHPLVQALFVLMTLDMVAGVAANRRTLSLDLMFDGVSKKVVIALLIGASSILAGVVPLPMTELVAGWYAAHELGSLAKHARALGLPVPAVFDDVAGRLQGAQKPSREGA